MSEKHQECSECGKPLAHRVHSPANGTHAYREPVASPQATSGVPPDEVAELEKAANEAEIPLRAAQPAAGTTPQAERQDESWRKLPIGWWFFKDSPECQDRYSVMERTNGGCTAVCHTGWHNEQAKRDMQSIAELHNRAVAPVETPLVPSKRKHIPLDLDEYQGVQTRLTAEQFFKQYAWDIGFDGMAITDRIRWAIVKFAEAFRDKSEAGLREETVLLEALANKRGLKIEGLQEEIERLKATNRELNRRCQALTHTINTNSDRKTWYGYYQAALSILGWEEEKFKKEAAGLREEIERLRREFCNRVHTELDASERARLANDKPEPTND